MIKLVAFDWNGTLLADTIPCWESANQVFKKMFGKEISFKKYLETSQVPIIGFYEANGIERETIMKKSAEITKLFHDYYERRIKKVRTRAGAREVLEWLGKKEIDAAIFSNHSETGVNSVVKRLGLEKYFVGILANSDRDTAMMGRNKEERLREYVEKKNLRDEEVLIVGDSLEEIEIGKNMGVKTVAMKYGSYLNSKLRLYSPDFRIGKLKELIKIIESI